MKNIVLRLLADEKVDSVFKVVETTWKDLTCIEVFYIKDKQYLVSRSFCTDMWISNQPFGPVVSDGGYLQCNILEDVASIFFYATNTEWRAHPLCTQEHLAKMYEYLNSYAKQIADKALGPHAEEIYNVRFTFSPSYMIIVTLVYKSVLLGSLSIDLQGHASVLTATVPNVYAIVNQINMNLKPMYKELAYVCQQDSNC